MYDNLSYVNHRSNKVAHNLAHQIPMELIENIWDSDFPNFLVNDRSDLVK